MSEENVFDNIQGVTYHFSKEGLLEDWREEALRHREEIEKLKEQNKMLKEAVKEKVIATCNTCEDYGICPHSYREYDLDNIIKEVREYIKDNSTDKYLLKSFDIDVLLEILDKENKYKRT